ncbi:unnamed protein product [Fusarium venenatum]|uniref:Uncharacterized protein n=1 Tax=Fusarium venenatum TaxID=56646 RepID=A0A2L2TJ50_9HYPO|nr:uncharacterized protein FVRRES_11069 [Fusarium venenatum]CEI70992.1 unnamed protein product [Fusarium venenatum]
MSMTYGNIPEQRRRNNEGIGLLPSELDIIVKALKLCVQRHANAFVQMSEAVLELIASNTRNATREQSHTDAGGTRPLAIERSQNVTLTPLILR